MINQQNDRNTRVDVKIDAFYSYRGNTAQGLVTNVSISGIGMEVRQIFVPGDLLKITLKLSATEEVVFWGVVKNVMGYNIGIQYEEISDSNLEKIKEFVAKKLVERGLAPREKYS